MTLIEWSDSFRLGISEIDHEHQALIDLINRLHAALGRTASKKEVFEFFVDLHAEIAAHFALEETMMRRLRYDRLAVHKDDHERLLDQLREMMDRQLAGGSADFEAALSDVLRDWFVAHFKSEDARLHRWLQGSKAL